MRFFFGHVHFAHELLRKTPGGFAPSFVLLRNGSRNIPCYVTMGLWEVTHASAFLFQNNIIPLSIGYSAKDTKTRVFFFEILLKNILSLEYPIISNHGQNVRYTIRFGRSWISYLHIRLAKITHNFEFVQGT